MVGSKQIRAVSDTWKAISTRHSVKRIAKRAIDIGGTSIISFTLNHVSRPVAIALFLGTIIWLERVDPNEDECDDLDEEIDNIVRLAHHPPTQKNRVTALIHRQFPNYRPQTAAEQNEFWRLVGTVRDKLGMPSAA